jgi:hypothetical protein
MNNLFKTFLTVASKEQTINTIGFLSGLTYTILNDKEKCIKLSYKHESDKKQTNVDIDTSELSIRQYPLSTLFSGCINGVLYGMCSSFVAGLMPIHLRPIVPFFVSLSMIDTVCKAYWSRV